MPKVNNPVRNPIARKISTVTLLIIILFGLLATIAVYYLFYSSILNVTLKETSYVSERRAQTLRDIISILEEANSSLSKNPVLVEELYSGRNDETKLATAIDSYERGNRYLAVYVMDRDGNTIYSTDQSLQGQNYAFRDYFKKAQENESWIQAAYGATTKQLGYYFSNAVRGANNEFLGITVLKVNPEFLEGFLVQKTTDKLPINIMLVDPSGVIISSEEETKLLKSLGAPDPLQIEYRNSDKKFGDLQIPALSYQTVQDDIRNLSDTPKTYRLFDAEDRKFEILIAQKVPSYPFYVVTEIYTSEFTKPTIIAAGSVASLVVLAAFIAALSVTFFLTKFLQPIKLLTQYAIHLVKGDTRTIPNILTTNDEFEELSRALNIAVTKLLNANAECEKQVEDKTSELNKQQEALINILEEIEEEKKLSEQRSIELEKYKLAVDSSQDHIVITDSDGIILYANPAVEKVTGFPVTEIIGKKAGNKNLWGGLMTKSFYDIFWKTIKKDKKPFSGEIKNRRKSGETYVARASVSPVVNKNGEVIFFVGIERDISIEKEVDRMKTEFISLASHQLRTPLSAIKWFVELVLNGDAGKITETQKEYMNSIQESNDRMIELVNSLLNISRIESGRITITPENTEIKPLIDGVLKDLTAKIKEKEVKIKLEISKSLPVYYADVKLLRNVYLNLISNAVKYTNPKGKVTINVFVENERLVSVVTDSGIGIPVEEQGRIFERFFRAANAVKLETDGNGLGLYLVKQIMEACGGTISFTSEQGKGTSFRISLPIEGMKEKIGEVRIDA